MDSRKIRDYIIRDIKYCKSLKAELNAREDSIEILAREYLEELRKINGWEHMIKECGGHYDQYPDEFFGRCFVTYADTAIHFKRYSDGSNYIVLEINLHKSLEQQVKEAQIRAHELEESKRLKEKYENKAKDGVH